MWWQHRERGPGLAQGRCPGEEDIELVLKEMRELRKGKGWKRHSRQGEQHKQRQGDRNRMVCMRPEF